MAALAKDIHTHIKFPLGYRGRIYLIGCKTASVVSDLKHRLDQKTGLNLDVRGTTELLQTTHEGGIVLRDPPKNGKMIGMRQNIDLQRSYCATLVRLRDLRWQACLKLEAIRGQLGISGMTAAVVLLLDQQELCKESLGAINTGLQQLASARDITLVGRRKGLESVRDAFLEADGITKTVMDALEILIDYVKGLRSDEDVRPVVGDLIEALRENWLVLNTRIDVWVLMIQTHDEPDLLKSKPFHLHSMIGPKRPSKSQRRRQRRERYRPPRVSLGELGRRMNIFEMLDPDPDRRDWALARAAEIADELKKRL
jgi:hypothetical protein